MNRAEINILKKLIDMQPQVASKEVLLTSGWPGRVVGPNSLNMAIKSIRTALDTLGASDIIITVPKEGFKLSENVRFLQHMKIKEVAHEPPSIKDNSNLSAFITPLNRSLFLLALLSLVTIKALFLFRQPNIECKHINENIKVCAIENDIFNKFNAKGKPAGIYALGRSYEAVHIIKEVKIK
ncbi:winged helix-turn-helix domain-containing protein [Aeromonas jandaei]|uniref:winged helix-turn-helix domain-containing protein n=1 Tax=Aeromonas jandaei TaxID=650 RepID=UPI0038CFED8D